MSQAQAQNSSLRIDSMVLSPPSLHLQISNVPSTGTSSEMALALPSTSGTTSQQPLLPQPQPVDGILDNRLYKSRLQTYTQRAKLPFPQYRTINEAGTREHPKFRSTVVVDGKTYSSLNTFSSRKAAEHDVAKVALEGINQNIKDYVSNIKDYVSKKSSDGELPPIYEDRIFCKSILKEFADKTDVKMPTYNTHRVEGVIPAFVSSVDFNGRTYTGDRSVTKKEAEQLAARAAILAILGTSGTGTLLAEIIKSKAELLSALHKPSCSNVDSGISPVDLYSASHHKHSVNSGEPSKEDNKADSMIISKIEEKQSPAVLRHNVRDPNAETVPVTIHVPIAYFHSLQHQSKKKMKKRKPKNKVQTEGFVGYLPGAVPEAAK